MTTNTKQVWHYFWIAVFLIGVLNLLKGCVRYVEVAPKPEEVAIELEPWAPCVFGGLCQIGQVVCSQKNRPVIVLRKGIDSVQKPFTMTHERVHTAQMQGNCEAVRLAYRDNENVRWQMELDAYCGEAEARIKSGMPIKGVLSGLSAILHALYNATEEDIYCNWMKPGR